ncbi:cytochrome P450 [Ramaria rubella]|nr:cytochrome P450 [Ramaria rubella]
MANQSPVSDSGHTVGQATTFSSPSFSTMSILDLLPNNGGALQLFIGSILLLFCLNVYLKYRRVVNSMQHHPGYRLFHGIDTVIGNALPRIPGVSMGQHWAMIRKHKHFAESGWDVLSVISFYPKIKAFYVLADPLAIKEVTVHRARFPKPVEDYKVLSFFGQNIVITEHDEWKKHRKICAPPFSERNNKLVWDETIRIVLDMFDNWGVDNSEVVIDHIIDVTLPLALLIIGVAGFGRRVSWAEDKQIPPGHQMSFKDALHSVSTYVQLKLIAPNWAYRFSKFLRHVQLANDELQMYMQEMITDRRASQVKEERYDLFSALLDANENDKEASKLIDQEVIGDIFVFLIAGHETTAHTLGFTLGLLALEQDEQEKLYQHVTSVLPNGGLPSYEHMNTLSYSMAVFYETLRLYPPVASVPKVSLEDTTLPVVRPDGSVGFIPVAKGTKLSLNTTGLHYNPRYWPDPETFKPSRFLGDYPKDAFLPFSGGARACLGRRFSETESVAIITMIVMRYKIEVKNPELYDRLTILEKREKLLKSRPGITTTPISVPLVFKRR